jgi:hypothetical protein
LPQLAASFLHRTGARNASWKDMPFEHVIVGVDFSETSREALRAAARLVAGTPARLALQAPIAPGMLREVRIAGWEPMAPGEPVVEAVVEVRGVDPARAAGGGDLRGQEDPGVGDPRLGEREDARLDDRLREDREAFLAGLRHAALARLPLARLGVVRVHAELLRDDLGGRAPGEAVERPRLLHAHDIDRECAQLTSCECDAAVERRLGAPEVQCDDAEVTAHGTRSATSAFRRRRLRAGRAAQVRAVATTTQRAAHS